MANQIAILRVSVPRHGLESFGGFGQSQQPFGLAELGRQAGQMSRPLLPADPERALHDRDHQVLFPDLPLGIGEEILVLRVHEPDGPVGFGVESPDEFREIFGLRPVVPACTEQQNARYRIVWAVGFVAFDGLPDELLSLRENLRAVAIWEGLHVKGVPFFARHARQLVAFGVSSPTAGVGVEVPPHENPLAVRRLPPDQRQRLAPTQVALRAGYTRPGRGNRSRTPSECSRRPRESRGSP